MQTWIAAFILIIAIVGIFYFAKTKSSSFINYKLAIALLSMLSVILFGYILLTLTFLSSM